MSLETFGVMLLFFAFVVHRRQVLSTRLALAEARVRAEPMLPLMKQPDRVLPWRQ